MERIVYLIAAVLLTVLAHTGLSDGDKDQAKIGMRCFAGIFLLAAVFLHFLKGLTGGLRILLLLLQLGIAAYFAWMLLLYLVGVIFRAGEENAPVLVLGTILEEDRPSILLEGRLKAAERYLKDHPQTQAVVTGGQVNDEILPEGEVMYRWLLSHQIDASRLRKETESQTTLENFRCSLPILQDLGYTEDKTLLVVTDRFHFLRVLWLGRRSGYRRLRLIPAETSLKYTFCWYFREVLVFVKFFVEGPQ